MARAPAKVNRNSGAESTIEALLALQRIAEVPTLRSTCAIDRSAMPPSRWRTSRSREFTARPLAAQLVAIPVRPPRQIVERVLMQRAPSGAASTARTPITLTYWPAANPAETRLAMRLAEQWNAANTDVQVRVQPLPAGRSSEEVLLAAIVAKATPDVCPTSHRRCWRASCARGASCAWTIASRRRRD